MSDIIYLLINIILFVLKPIFYLLHLDELCNYLKPIVTAVCIEMVETYKLMFVMFVCILYGQFFKESIFKSKKKKTIYMKLKEKIIKFSQKCDFWYHSWFNDQAYQYHKETKLDREAFGIEEQIFHQSVPPRI